MNGGDVVPILTLYWSAVPATLNTLPHSTVFAAVCMVPGVTRYFGHSMIPARLVSISARRFDVVTYIPGPSACSFGAFWDCAGREGSPCPMLRPGRTSLLSKELLERNRAKSIN